MTKLKEIKDKLDNNKALYISWKVVKIIFSIFLFIALCVVLIQKFFNNKAIMGYRVFSVASESMKEEYSIGDIIVIKEVPASELKVGDNVTYLGKKGNLNDLIITHKILSIRKDNDDYYYITKGTSNEYEDPEISYSQIYGKVFYKTVVFSYFGRLMSNNYSYYTLFTIVGLYASYQIVKIKFEDEEDEDEQEQEETKDNS
jgi:signal peptidase